MLNFLSRINQYMSSNMREHGKYLLELEPLDEDGRQADRARCESAVADRTRRAGAPTR